MLMKKQLIIYVSLALLSLAACVTDFTPEVKGVSGILVVDGTITDGESVFRLSRSVGITDDIRSADTITNAEVSVERSDGVFFEGKHEGNGFYRVRNLSLDPGLEYNLKLKIGDKTYHSTALKPLFTPEIDSVSFGKASREEPTSVYVSTHADKGSSPYYRWSYRENWEVRSSLYANAREENGQLIWHNLNTSENTYYCWAKDSSKTLLLGSAEKLVENRIQEHKILDIPLTDERERLSVLYHVEVSQVQLRKDAYEYFKILWEEIERGGDIFSPILSAGNNGNVFCDSDPDELIIGFVEVASTTRKSLFIPYDDFLYEPASYLDCWLSNTNTLPIGMSWYRYPEVAANPRCVDCRTKPGATKNRPAWWPNEHY